jgi:uncharacterized protein (DUF58 family)
MNGRLLKDWTRRRQGVDRGTATLIQRRVYILPTRSGMLFGLVLFTMLLGALNYSNNMGFALAFALCSITIASIHQCQRNLAGLELRIAGCAPVFAGEPVQCDLKIMNPGRSARWQIGAGANGPDGPTADIGPGETATWKLVLRTRRRGALPCPGIRVSTRYPLGLFQAWGWLYPDLDLMVYPRPADAGARGLPSALGDLDLAGEAVRGTDEFVGLRQPVPGESPSRLAWKTLARGGPLLAKDYRSGALPAWLDWNALPGSDPEIRLSRLTRMLLDAEAEGRAFGLRLPGIEIPPATGAEHRHRCLRFLATFDPGDANHGR